MEITLSLYTIQCNTIHYLVNQFLAFMYFKFHLNIFSRLKVIDVYWDTKFIKNTKYTLSLIENLKFEFILKQIFKTIVIIFGIIRRKIAWKIIISKRYLNFL